MKSLLIVCIALSIFSGMALTSSAQKSVKFIEGIETRGGDIAMHQFMNAQVNMPGGKLNVNPVNSSSTIFTEDYKRIQFKYAQLLNRHIEVITNLSLFQFIEDWWDTRYRFGGTSKKGIDCSALTGLLMKYVYAIKLPRTARQQYAASSKISKNEMAEGDMVFFNTRGRVSHVGVYLGDGYFVHSSTTSGVTINNLDEGYYNSRFIGARRVL